MNKKHTSALESVSASLCFISLAIEKKTCSTFRLVFALCGTKSFQYKATLLEQFPRVIHYLQFQRI